MPQDASHSGQVPPAGAGVGARGLLEAWRSARGTVALAILLVLVGYWWLTMVALGGPEDWAFDFRQFWQGGRDVWNGVSPYPSSRELDSVREEFNPYWIQDDYRFPYPAGAAVLLAPLGALGFGVAAAIWGALLIASVLGAVWILGVRDWRVLAVVVTSQPVISSVRLGTFTPVLLLLVALAWRWRERRWVVGGALAAALSLKLFLWPLAVWLAATRRFAAAGLTVCLALLGTLASWAAIGFAGLSTYPELLRRLEELVDDIGLSLVALGVQLGLPDAVSEALPLVAGLPLLAAAVVVARRDDGDRRAFSLALLASFALTPIVWQHYFALLVVPLALARPRLAWPWALLWVFWLVPGQGNEGALLSIVLAAAVAGAVVAYCALTTARASQA